MEPDCVDYEGWTPLHAAALWGQKEAAVLLLKSGADPHLKNYSVSHLLLDDVHTSHSTHQPMIRPRVGHKSPKRTFFQMQVSARYFLSPLVRGIITKHSHILT